MPSSTREPHLLRFRLRQMFFLVTLLSLLCGLLVLTDGPWPLLIVVSTLLIAAHVFGTLVGTRLRDSSHEVRQWRSAHPTLDNDVPKADMQPTLESRAHLPPVTTLADHGSVSNWLLWFVLGGALLGTLVGGLAIGLIIGPRIGWAGWAVGTLSCGVLGTWAAFLASSFSSIARHAWRHAHEKGK